MYRHPSFGNTHLYCNVECWISKKVIVVGWMTDLSSSVLFFRCYYILSCSRCGRHCALCTFYCCVFFSFYFFSSLFLRFIPTYDFRISSHIRCLAFFEFLIIFNSFIHIDDFFLNMFTWIACTVVDAAKSRYWCQRPTIIRKWLTSHAVNHICKLRSITYMIVLWLFSAATIFVFHICLPALFSFVFFRVHIPCDAFVCFYFFIIVIL